MIGRALKLLRQFHGLNQVELSQALDVSKSYVCEIEAGKKQPTLSMIERYAEKFEIPASSLLLFAEQLESGSRSDRTRVQFAKKILILLEWISETEHDEHAETTAHN